MSMPGRSPSSFSAAYTAFISSMEMNVEKWRDGIGFDLTALKDVTEDERVLLLRILVDKLETQGDWREIEALAEIGTPEALSAIRRAAEQGSPETRVYAARQLAEIGEDANLENSIIDGLRNTSVFGGLTQALDMAEDHPSPRIQETLLDLALNGDDEQRIHCAALALYLGGKAEEPFDWNHRPFFLQFVDDDRKIQIEAYRELCRRLGVTPAV